MPIKRRWKTGITLTFFILSSSLLLVSCKVIDNDVTDVNELHIQQGVYFRDDVPVPFFSHSEYFFISLNVSVGLVSFYILDLLQYRDYNSQSLEFEGRNPSFQIKNTTEFEGIILIDPPIQNTIFIMLYTETSSIVSLRISFQYIAHYRATYGIFFMSISLIMLTYYIVQIFKKRF